MAGKQSITHGAGGECDALSSVPSALYGGRSGQISCVPLSSTTAHGARAGPYTRAPAVLPGQCHGDHCAGPADPHDAHRPTGLWGAGPLPPSTPWHDRPLRPDDLSLAATLGRAHESGGLTPGCERARAHRPATKRPAHGRHLRRFEGNSHHAQTAYLNLSGRCGGGVHVAAGHCGRQAARQRQRRWLMAGHGGSGTPLWVRAAVATTRTMYTPIAWTPSPISVLPLSQKD